MRLSAKRNRAIGGSGICVAARGSIVLCAMLVTRIEITPAQDGIDRAVSGRVRALSHSVRSSYLLRPTLEGYPRPVTQASHQRDPSTQECHSTRCCDERPARAIR